MEGKLGLARAVDVRVLLGLHAPVLVVQHGLDDAVADRLWPESVKS
jgi:hypothetical protein